MTQVVQNRWLRGLYMSLGFLTLGLGIIGTVLPGIPTTMPIILAAFFFSKSSQRFDDWMLNHKLFGPLVRDWRAGVGFSARAKAIAITAIAITFTITVVWAVDVTAVRIGLVVLAMGITAYILWLPTKQVRSLH
ncbi:MAG: YbaN family protein [Acidimicrobiia bacterium]|nr:YbaN family protein [Acidimicrobiia bacterium]MDH3397879.1 YbaN family protein [Acidimicrobiia bacterium]MDH5615746.1 YbaN family protein [Acidimicrobiia bacterium]